MKKMENMKGSGVRPRSPRQMKTRGVRTRSPRQVCIVGAPNGLVEYVSVTETVFAARRVAGGSEVDSVTKSWDARTPISDSVTQLF